MKMIAIALILSFGLIGCGTSTDNTKTQGDTYVVAVDNVGDGDVVVNTGSGTLTLNQEGDCVHEALDGNITDCTQDQILQASDATELALYKI